MFKCGDRVRLSEGGQVMSVTGVGPDSTGRPTVWCAWFNDQNVHNTSSAMCTSLRLSTKAQPIPSSGSN
ncbi:DUF2158 domain-containing protein [Novosphingobium hassiacum]